MRCYRVEFRWHGADCEEIVRTLSHAAACSAIEARYPGAHVYNVSLVR